MPSTVRVKCPANIRLMDTLYKIKKKPITPCGGRGNCGKCLVKVVEGNLPINTTDHTWLSEEKLAEGYRLGCHAFPKEEVVVEFEMP